MSTTITRGTRSGYSCKDFSRINPNSGLGFILTRLAMFPDSTRAEVYRDSPYYSKYFGPGYHSAIWAWALENGLIASNGGDEWVICGNSYYYQNQHIAKRALGKSENGKYVVRYRLTDYGRSILNKMTDRRGMPRFTEVSRTTPPPVRVPEMKSTAELRNDYASAAMEADRIHANGGTSSADYRNVCILRDSLAKAIKQREDSRAELRDKISGVIRELQEILYTL